MDENDNYKSFTYRCTRMCPIGKKCFLFKTTTKITNGFTVLFKCLAKNKQDIEIPILGIDSITCK